MKTVCIDAGHGGHDHGGPSLGTREKALVLPYALELADRLRATGFRVVLTRMGDDFVAISERARIANHAGADLFVSIHANASASPSARGPWTLYANGSAKGQRIAQAVQAVLAPIFEGKPEAVYPDASSWVGYTSKAQAAIEAGKKDGLKTSAALDRAGITQPFRTIGVLRQTRMPAVLVELGFMTNPHDLAAMEQPSVRARVVSALARVVAAKLVGTVPDIPAVTPKLAPRPKPSTLGRARTVPPRLEHVPIPIPARALAPSPAPEEAAVIVQPKPASKSRTIWLNAATVLAAGAAIVGDALNLATQTGIALPEDVTKYALLAVGVANILLRRSTTQPIGDPRTSY